MAFSSPDRTTCPGQLKLAVVTCPEELRSSQSRIIMSSLRPSTAAMVPGRVFPATCMACPRTLTTRKPSSTRMTPAATSAASSPTLCPATRSGCSPRLLSTSRAAMLWAKIAGCVTAVCLSDSAGPLKQNDLMSMSSTSSTRSKILCASGAVLYRSCPMPTNWEPCPGNRKAVFAI